MTILENSIRITAPPARVWSVLAQLDALHDYDPGVLKSALLAGPRSGLGASRQCDLRPGGWFRERVTEWEREVALTFKLIACTLPVKALSYRYRLVKEGDETIVHERMEYALKFGPLGKALDRLVMRRKWSAGINASLGALKRRVEQERSRP